MSRTRFLAGLVTIAVLGFSISEVRAEVPVEDLLEDMVVVGLDPQDVIGSLQRNGYLVDPIKGDELRSEVRAERFNDDSPDPDLILATFCKGRLIVASHSFATQNLSSLRWISIVEKIRNTTAKRGKATPDAKSGNIGAQVAYEASWNWKVKEKDRELMSIKLSMAALVDRPTIVVTTYFSHANGFPNCLTTPR